MADPGEGPGGPGLPLVLDQTEARRAEKIFLEDRPPLSKGLDDQPPLISWSWSGTACTCTANATIRTKGFHYNPLPLQPKFRFVDISPIRIFALAKFRGCEFFLRRKFGKMKFLFSGCEISPRWQRNFVWLNENSRALWRNFVEFSREQRTKNTEFSFAQHFFCTVLYKKYISSSNLPFNLLHT